VILALFGLIALISVHLAMLWKALQERTARWKLYELRDRLRWAAIENENVRNSALFDRIDLSLTVLAANLRDLSLWSLLPAIIAYRAEPEQHREEERQIKAAMNTPGFEPVKSVFLEAAKIFVQHLACRHLFLTALAIATIFGAKFGNDFLGWLSRRLVTRVIRPAVPRHVDVGEMRAA
jgi:hypothetical protein